jgi:hypothetical protein
MQGLLNLSSQGMLAYSLRKGAITLDEHFIETDSGRDAFRSYLREHRSIPFRLLVDLPDEGFREEAIPPSRGADRRTIIERRLAQSAGATPYAAAVSLGKQHSGRRNEVLMLATLTRPGHLAPWLDVCVDAGTLLQQITSPPFLLGPLLKSLRLHQGRHLLFTLGSGGLRQTYFDAGQLQFSRLTASLSPGEAAAICFDEAYKVRHYLSSGTRPAAEAQFHVLIPNQDIPAFEARRMAGGDVPINIVDLSRLEIEHGVLSSHPNDSTCDVLLLHLMAKGLSPAQFAPVQLLAPYRLWQWRRQLKRFGSAVFGCCLASALAYGLLGWDATEEAQAQEYRNQEAQRRYQALLQTLPSLPVPIDEVRAVSAGMRALQATSRVPEASFRLLSHALDEVPEVELDRIEWRTVTSPEGGKQGAQKRPPRTTTVTTIDAHVPGTASERIDAISAAENLAARLRTMPDTKVEVVPAPSSDGAPPSNVTDDRVSLRLIQGSH